MAENQSDPNNTEPDNGGKILPLTEILPLLRYKLSTDEQKILYAFITKLNETEKDSAVVSFRVEELISVCGLETADGEAILMNAAKNLCRRVFTGKDDENNIIISGWILAATFYSRDRVIKFDFDLRLKPYYLELKKTYFQKPGGLILSFRHGYTPQLYDFLQKLPTGQSYNFTIESLVKEFSLPRSYQTNVSNFKNLFWELAVDEINAKTQLAVVYDYVKTGRAITGLRVAVAVKKGAKLPKMEMVGEDIGALSMKEKALMVRLTNKDRWQLTEERAEKLIWQYGAAQVKRNLDYAATEDKPNPGEWLIECIEGDYARSDALRRKNVGEQTASAPENLTSAAPPPSSPSPPPPTPQKQQMPPPPKPPEPDHEIPKKSPDEQPSHKDTSNTYETHKEKEEPRDEPRETTVLTAEVIDSNYKPLVRTTATVEFEDDRKKSYAQKSWETAQKVWQTTKPDPEPKSTAPKSEPKQQTETPSPTPPPAPSATASHRSRVAPGAPTPSPSLPKEPLNAEPPVPPTAPPQTQAPAPQQQQTPPKPQPTITPTPPWQRQTSQPTAPKSVPLERQSTQVTRPEPTPPLQTQTAPPAPPTTPEPASPPKPPIPKPGTAPNNNWQDDLNKLKARWQNAKKKPGSRRF